MKKEHKLVINIIVEIHISLLYCGRIQTKNGQEGMAVMGQEGDCRIVLEK